LRGALAGTDSCLAAIGTGSFFFAANSLGSPVQSAAGALPQAMTAAAHGLVKTLRLVLHCNDGLAPHSDLTRAVLLEFGNTAAQLATFAQQASPGDFGQYAIKVVSAAEAGDTQALTLRQNTVQAIQTGLDTVGFTCQQPVCLVGGLDTALRGVLDPSYHQWVIPPKGNALSGAIAIAQNRWGLRAQSR
jgi:glucosamine kinase